MSPPGFHVIFLPFSEDIRSLELPDEMPKGTCSRNIFNLTLFTYCLLKHPMNRLIKQRRLSRSFPLIFKVNLLKIQVLTPYPLAFFLISLFYQFSLFLTVIQKHYRVLEALALEHEEVEEITDLTLPDAAQINKRAGKVIDEFMKAVFPDGFDPEARITKRKVRIVQPVKKVHSIIITRHQQAQLLVLKRQKQMNQLMLRPLLKTELYVIPMHAYNNYCNFQLGKLTIPILKDYLKSVGKKVAGKKQDLIDAVNEHLGL